MALADKKHVRVLAAPTGPTGTMQGVRIFANITGPSGQYAQRVQINASQIGPTGTFETVYAVGASFANAPTGTIKTIIIPGYTGPA